MTARDSTSPSLLVRLRNREDKEAWDRFYDLYAPLVLGFVRQRGGSPELACDVLQETMVCLLRCLPDFRYAPEKGKFRSFLLKVVAARLCDAFRRNQRYQAMSDVLALVERHGYANGVWPDVDNQHWERLWQHNLLLRALARVRTRVNSRTYRCFELYALKNVSVDAIAAELRLAPNAIYQQRNRVVRMLRQEIARLKTEMGD